MLCKYSFSLWRRFQKGKKHNEDKVEVRRALNVNWVKLTFFLKRYILFTNIQRLKLKNLAKEKIYVCTLFFQIIWADNPIFLKYTQIPLSHTTSLLIYKPIYWSMPTYSVMYCNILLLTNMGIQDLPDHFWSNHQANCFFK